MSGLGSHDYGTVARYPLPESARKLVWRLACQLLTDHPWGPNGYCQTCRPRRTYPCLTRRLAIIGLLRAGRRRPLARMTPPELDGDATPSGDLR